jgi:phage-related minor tail protein
VQQSLRNWIDEVTNVAKATEALLTNAFRSIEDALVNLVRTGKLDFRSLADSIIADLIRIQIRQQMLPWLSNPATGSSLIGWLSGMFRAQGGPVSAARPYVVGEQGPELFVPNVSGMMLAHAALQSDAAPNVSIYQNITVDARADRASVIAAMHQAKESAKLEIMRSLQRGGGFHQALGR